ncbi:TIR domain-containing protein [Pseudarthrobacter sp. H3Y2-7]|nr:tetratricopeptide repeat protein [Pseudarthrobacter sp. H3Y2-7]MDE8668407.1 TIR domain-containing protein [Pseudarthrobacter sp. H3Y2-7]
MAGSGGVFLSHAWLDQSPQRRAENPRRGLAPMLRDFLMKLGIEVFFDDADIEDFDAIGDRVRAGMAESALFVCWYSDAYAHRRACHWELTAAVAVDPSRVFVINPEPGIEHILPTSLRANLIADAPRSEDTEGWAALAVRIADRAHATHGTFTQIVDADAVPLYGDPPLRFQRFVGRASDLWRLDGLLRPPPAVAGGDPAPRAVVVQGMGGLGKTALVREYASRFAAAYPGGIFWLRLSTPAEGGQRTKHIQPLLETQLGLIARQLRPLQIRPGDTDLTVQLQNQDDVIADHLGSLDRPFLWVVDDLPPGLSAAEFASALPPKSAGRTVVTTQGSAYRHVPNLPLDVMDDEEAVELLLAQTPRAEEADKNDALALVAKLGHLPLAVDVVGALVAMPGSSAGSLLAELDKPGDELALVEEAATNAWTSVSPTGHASSAMATFAPSIRRLREDAFIMLAVAATVNVGPLPVQTLIPVVRHFTNGELTTFGTRHALGELLNLSLVRALDPDTVELHGLIGFSTLQYVQNPETFHAAVIEDLSTQIADDIGDVEDITTHRRNLRLAAFGASLALQSPTPDDTFDLRALRALGRFLHVEQRYPEAAQIHALALKKARFESGGAETRESLIVAANLALDLGKTKPGSAAKDLEAILDSLTRLYGSDDRDTLTIEHNLANQIFAVDPERSRRLHLDAYERRLRTLGPDDPHTLFSLHSLLSQGVTPHPYPDAVVAYTDLIARRTRALGKDHTTTLTSLSNFIERLIAAGNLEEAQPLARQLVERRSALYGPDHGATWAARIRLLSVLSGLPNPPDDEIHSQLLAFSSVPDSVDAKDVVNALASAGEILRRAGRYERALDLLEMACKTASARLPADDSAALLAEHNRAALIGATSAPAKATAIFGDLVPRMTHALGPEHRLTLRARRQQLIMLARSGAAQEAIPGQQDLAEYWRQHVGEQSAFYAEALGDLAESFSLLGRADEKRHYQELQQQAAAHVGHETGWV